jgi:hypothetical protein
MLDGEARHLGVSFHPVNDKNSDLYGFADGRSPGGLAFPSKYVGEEVFQYHNCPSPIPRDVLLQFEGKLAKLTKKPGQPVSVVVFFTPNNHVPPDLEWLDTMKARYPHYSLDLWGYSRYQNLLWNNFPLLERLYPHLCMRDNRAIRHLDELKSKAIARIRDDAILLEATYGSPNDFLDVKFEILDVGGTLTSRPTKTQVASFRAAFWDIAELKKLPLFSDLSVHFPKLQECIQLVFQFQEPLLAACINAATRVCDEYKRAVPLPDYNGFLRQTDWVARERLSQITVQRMVWPERTYHGFERREEALEIVPTDRAGSLAKATSAAPLDLIIAAGQKISTDPNLLVVARDLRALLRAQAARLSEIRQLASEILLLQYLQGCCAYTAPG